MMRRISLNYSDISVAPSLPFCFLCYLIIESFYANPIEKLIICLFLLLVSCNKNKVEDKQLLRAEILISFSPDSSYQIL